jgi:hypothetical protein
MRYIIESIIWVIQQNTLKSLIRGLRVTDHIALIKVNFDNNDPIMSKLTNLVDDYEYRLTVLN